MEKTTLYRGFDAAGDLLYVGISLSALQRFQSHKKESPWFNEAKTITMEQFNSRQEALAAERKAIKIEKPKYNVVHNGNCQNTEMFVSEELGIKPDSKPQVIPQQEYSGKADGGPLNGLTLTSTMDFAFKIDKEGNIYSYGWKDDHWQYLTSMTEERDPRIVSPYQIEKIKALTVRL